MKWWTVIALWFGMSLLSVVMFHAMISNRDMETFTFDSDDDADVSI
jgi:hypothetical protein